MVEVMTRMKWGLDEVVAEAREMQGSQGSGEAPAAPRCCSPRSGGSSSLHDQSHCRSRRLETVTRPKEKGLHMQRCKVRRVIHQSLLIKHKDHCNQLLTRFTGIQELVNFIPDVCRLSGRHDGRRRRRHVRSARRRGRPPEHVRIAGAEGR